MVYYFFLENDQNDFFCSFFAWSADMFIAVAADLSVLATLLLAAAATTGLPALAAA
jgi:hypothetical protein